MPGRYVVSKQFDGRFHFVLKASNGEVVLSSEAYSTKNSALVGIESMRHNGSLASRFEIKNSSNGRFYFLLKAQNHQVLGVSELYRDRASAEGGIALAKKLAPAAETVEAIH